MRLLAASLWLWAAAASAQSFTSGKRLLLSEGVLRGSPRLMGLSGTYVAIAEGAEGLTRNPAAVAHEDPHFEKDLNVDFAGTMHFLFPGGAQTQDWDNDGLIDQRAGIESSQVFYSVASVQYGIVGAGLGFDLQNFQGSFGQGDVANLSFLHLFGSLGLSIWEDTFLVGFGVESSSTWMGYLANQGVEDGLDYHGWGYQFGGLFRPKDQDWRMGFSYKPQVLARPTRDAQTVGPLQAPGAVVTPARISVGGSYALGSGGRAFNIASRAGLIETGEVDEHGLPVFSAAMTKWLLSAQLDVVLPVADAATVSAVLAQQSPELAALPAGDRLTFQPRVAIEKELWADRFRIRGGGYLEPAVVTTGSLRPHVTFGFELFLFKAGPQRLAFGLSFDFAQRYQNLSVAIVAWK